MSEKHDLYRAHRAAGRLMMNACVLADISIEDARLIEAGKPIPAAGEAASSKEPAMADEPSGGDAVKEEKKPDFQRAINVLRNDIDPAEESNASARGDLSAAWKIIEDECHVNKGAAKAFNKLRGMSDEKRDDYLRSLYGLMQTAHIGISRDLVDRLSASGEAPTMPVVERQRPKLATVKNDPPPKDDADLADGDAEESVVDKAQRAAAAE